MKPLTPLLILHVNPSFGYMSKDRIHHVDIGEESGFGQFEGCLIAEEASLTWPHGAQEHEDPLASLVASRRVIELPFFNA